MSISNSVAYLAEMKTASLDAYIAPCSFSLDNARVRQHLTTMKTTVSSKGQIVLPSELRDQDHILPGQQFSIERVEPGQYLLRKIDFPE